MNAISTFTFAVGVVNLVLAFLVWTLLRRRHAQAPVWAWSAASLAGGTWILLVASRGQIPSWASYQLASAVGFTTIFLRTAALRIDGGTPPRWRQLFLAWALCTLVFLVATEPPSYGQRLPVALLVHAAGAIWVASHALRAAKVMNSPNGRLLAMAEGLWACVLLGRASLTALGLGETLAFVPSTENWTLVSVGLLLAVSANLAYIGMVLDHSLSQTHQALQARATEQARRQQAEESNRELTRTLQQRDELFQQRERLLSVLAHEIRQPLHSATGALLSADSALRSAPATPDTAPVRERLLNAQNVLGELRSVLDNTLAAAEILTLHHRPVRQDVDLDWLLSLVLGDLSAAQREQTEVIRLTRLRSLEVEPGLFRLALRNLLRNAFAHGLGIQGRVRVVVEESTEPPALCIHVLDHGPGLSADRCQALMEPPASDRTDSTPPRERGLGLVIVRRIMALHGGQLTLVPAHPRGLRASLIFPWSED